MIQKEKNVVQIFCFSLYYFNIDAKDADVPPKLRCYGVNWILFQEIY